MLRYVLRIIPVIPTKMAIKWLIIKVNWYISTENKKDLLNKDIHISLMYSDITEQASGNLSISFVTLIKLHCLTIIYCLA